MRSERNPFTKYDLKTYKWMTLSLSERKLKELLEKLVKESQKKGLIAVRKQNLLMSVE